MHLQVGKSYLGQGNVNATDRQTVTSEQGGLELHDDHGAWIWFCWDFEGTESAALKPFIRRSAGRRRLSM